MRILALLLPLLLHLPASAGTLVTLERDGQVVEGGEICRFPAGQRQNAIRRWLTSQKTSCVAAGAAVEFPAGAWNVFARTGSAVSTEPALIDGAAAPSALTLQLAPAATITTNLAEEQTAVVYAPRRGTAVPIDRNTQRVPADEPLWLIVMEKQQPVSIFAVPPLEAGSERHVDARGAGVGFAIVAWLRFSEERDRAALEKAPDALAPHVRVTQGGPALDSDPLPPLGVLEGSLVLLRGVKAGEAEVDLGGRGWLPSRRRVNVTRAITLLNEPLLLRPSATLVVHWTITDSMRKLHATIGSCDDPDGKPPKLEIRISSCSPPRRREPPQCQVMRQETVAADADFGELTFEDVPPGMYRAEMLYGNLPPVSRMGQAAAFQHATLRLREQFWDLYGSLTRGGEPLGRDATIVFPSGAGFARAEDSEYQAALEDVFDTDAKIEIATCDGSLKTTLLAEGRMRPRARYDIDIPDNALIVDVTDTFTRMPLPGATVKLVVFTKLVPRRPALERTMTTEAGQGGGARATFVALPEREVHVTVSHAGYQKESVEPFTMPLNERKRLDVQLVPLRGSEGRIASARPFDDGSVVWFSAAGEETESADLWPDGTFFYVNSHTPDETMAIVSRSHPLWALRAVSASRGRTLEIPFPDVPGRTFEITHASGDRQITRMIGIAVGRMRIPQGALRAHQSLRDLPYVLRGPGPLVIRDIAETGPIDVTLGPRLEEVPHRIADPFGLPQYADAPRKRLEGGAEGVEFE